MKTMTVGELRKALEGVDDSMPIEVSTLTAQCGEVHAEIVRVFALGANVYCQDAFCIFCKDVELPKADPEARQASE